MKKIMAVWYSQYAHQQWQVYWEDGSHEEYDFPKDWMLDFIQTCNHWKRDCSMVCWFN